MQFKDKYFFLSTFYISNFTLDINGKKCNFSNAEAAYQAQKNPEIADRFYQVKGLEAKRLNLKITVPNWDEIHLYAMARALNAKFSNKLLFVQLKSITEDIIYENPYGDTFWGVSKGGGKNILGKMLMNIRDNNNNLEILNKYIKEELYNL